MTTVTVTLTADQARSLDRLVEAGEFLSQQDAIAAAIELLRDSRDRAALVDRLIQASREADEGNLEPGDGFDIIRRHFAEARSGR